MKLNVIRLFSELLKLGKVETDNGTLIFEGDVLTEGMEVFIEDENGNIVPAPDGQYSEYIVKNGKVAPKEAEPATEPEAEPAQEVEQAEEPAAEEPATEPEPEATPDYEERIAALENELADLKAAIAELQKEKDDMEFSALKPAEKEIKDIVSKANKGALKYFEK